MTNQDYFEFAEEFFGECLAISRKKNADYTGDASNPFANFEAVEMLHIGTAQGFLTRMQDKMMRIATFAKNGELQVKDESVTDTLRDLANYSCLMAGWIESRKLNTVKPACDPKDMPLAQRIQMEYFDAGEDEMNFPLVFLEKVKNDLNLPFFCTYGQLNQFLVNLLGK